MDFQNRRRPVLFSVSGPYGVGKDTILDIVAARYPTRVYRVRALTTRTLVDEADGIYESVSSEELASRTSQGTWIVNQQLSNSASYATSVDEIEAAAARGLICIQHIFAGPYGAGKLRTLFGSHLFSVGLLPAGSCLDEQLAVLAGRLAKRRRDDPASLQKRLEHQREPIQYVMDNCEIETCDGRMSVFDEIVINDAIDSTGRYLLDLFKRRLLVDE